MKRCYELPTDEDGHTIITRAQLHKAVDLSIASAKRQGFQVRQAHCYHAIADDVDLIAKPWEANAHVTVEGEKRTERCGCLVGSLRLKRGMNPEPPHTASVQNAIGYAFPSCVEEVLDTYHASTVLRVVD